MTQGIWPICPVSVGRATGQPLRAQGAHTPSELVSRDGDTVSMLTGPSRWGHAPGRSAAHGRSLAGSVDPVRIPPLALDPYLVEQRYHRQHLRIFDVSIFVILDACLRPAGRISAGASWRVCSCAARGRSLAAGARARGLSAIILAST